MSATGRIANLLSTRASGFATASSRFHVRRKLAGKGQIMDRWFRAPVMVLTVAGRRTGQPRSVVLILTRLGDDVVVGGSNGGHPETPAWFRNLEAADAATVRHGDETWTVVPRLVTDPDERAECWAALVATYPDFETYQRLTDRQIPIMRLRRA